MRVDKQAYQPPSVTNTVKECRKILKSEGFTAFSLIFKRSQSLIPNIFFAFRQVTSTTSSQEIPLILAISSAT
ncbi:Uncharacterised protein [uncultured Blautia sp.]|nr:Uncharacterised protein [uncultured Blautia sp.]